MLLLPPKDGLDFVRLKIWIVVSVLFFELGNDFFCSEGYLSCPIDSMQTDRSFFCADTGAVLQESTKRVQIYKK